MPSSDSFDAIAPEEPLGGSIDLPKAGTARKTDEQESIKQKAVRGTAWGVGGQLVGNALRLGSNLILTRILAPEIFGLMALINMVLIGLHMITDVGVNASIMSSPRGAEPAFLRTAFTVQVVRGFVVALGVLALGHPMASFYEDERLALPVMAAAIVPTVFAFVSTRQYLAMRNMDVRRSTIVDLTSQALQLAANVALALWLENVWALVGGAIVQVLVVVSMSHLFFPGERDRFGWDKSCARELYDIAKWITISSATAFAAQRFDVGAFGKLITLDELGVYNQAIVIAMIPYQLVAPLVDQVLLPAMSAQLRADKDNFGAAVRASRRVVLRAFMFLVLSAGLCAPGFYYVMYKKSFHDAGWEAQLCLVAVWFMCLAESASRILLAQGSARPMATSNFVRFGGTALGVLLGFQWFGLPGGILGSAVGPLAAHGVMLVNLKQKNASLLAIDGMYTAVCLTVLAFGGYLPVWLAPRLGLPAPLVSIGTGALILAPLGLWVLKHTRAAIGR